MPTDSSIMDIATALGREPLPVLDIEGLPTRRLSVREEQIVRALVKIFAQGFADQTMADLAVGSGSSLRSLYRLAPSRTELVLLVMNQSLRQIAHESHKAACTAQTPLEAVALYVHRTAMSAAKMSPAHARDLAAIAEVRSLAMTYAEHRIACLNRLLLEAVSVGEIGAVDTHTFAVLADGLIAMFTGVQGETQKSMVRKVDNALASVLTGLERHGWGENALWAPTS